ncbi:MAG: DNA mismatch repair endonuclease MutL [Halanaerobiaceae bacterium]|nr:DNA mismatch repair endonuclease MutL [Halanaerobiaceae bacterium]
MGIIKQLPEFVSNQISAGEVIERPASIVKELVENSIDANSTRILIEIENGGRDKIRVKDNGHGILEDDIELAFSRYATSKIEGINDIYSIRTLGFRGEALASIAAVSRIDIYSKSKGAVRGTFLRLEGGEIIKKTPAGIPDGTDIIVTDVFYNTPARYKYLKTINTEFGHISSIVTREALAYPEIQFSLYHNMNEVLKTPGTGNLLDTIYTLYGEELVASLIPIDYEESYVQISGFIAKPEYSRSSRIYELFFVNKRTIHNRSLSKAVEDAYSNVLPPGRYPVVFLNIKLNPILVDVNVHPGKREIKFSREEIIEQIISKGIKKTLSEYNLAPKLKTKKAHEDSEKRQEHFVFSDSIDTEKKEKIRKNKIIRTEYPVIENLAHAKHKKGRVIDDEDYKKSSSVSYKKNYVDSSFVAEEMIQKKGDNKREEKLPERIKKILGQIENTYIVAEGTDGLYLIDQHNAHERILYEENYKKFKEKSIVSQSLLVPVNVELTLEEKEILIKYIENLKDLGFTLEEFGINSFIITELPLIIKELPGRVIVRDLIDNIIKNGKTLNQAEMINNMLTYMSCRAAIKAGKHLETIEMEELLINLFRTDNPHRCPHGRPIIVHLSSEEIARSMGR